MSIHLTRAPTVPLTSYHTKRSSHLKYERIGASWRLRAYVHQQIQIIVYVCIFRVIIDFWRVSSFSENFDTIDGNFYKMIKIL